MLIKCKNYKEYRYQTVIVYWQYTKANIYKKWFLYLDYIFTFSLTNPAMRFIASIYEKGIWIIKDNRLASACKKRAEKTVINAKIW